MFSKMQSANLYSYKAINNTALNRGIASNQNKLQTILKNENV